MRKLILLSIIFISLLAFSPLTKAAKFIKQGNASQSHRIILSLYETTL